MAEEPELAKSLSHHLFVGAPRYKHGLANRACGPHDAGGGSAREDPLQDVKEATADNSKSDTISVLEHLRGADYEVTWRLDNNGSQQSLM